MLATEFTHIITSVAPGGIQDTTDSSLLPSLSCVHSHFSAKLLSPSVSGRKGSSTTLIKSADDNQPGGAVNSTREDEEINEEGPGEFRKYGTGNNKMRVDAEECKRR